MHAYDIRIEPKFGKNEGNVKFKIRTNNENKLKTIESKINELGLKCQNSEKKKYTLKSNNSSISNDRQSLEYDNSYKNNSSMSNFKNSIKFIEKRKIN